jgi:hypothetical protein
MEINLRKANALQLSIKQAIKEIRLNNRISISRFEDPIARKNEGLKELQDALLNKRRLTIVLYKIRRDVARVGNKHVSDLLAAIAETDDLIEIIKGLAAVTDFAPVNDDALHAAWADMVNEPHGLNQYQRRRDEIEVNLTPKDNDYAKQVADLRKYKQELSDKLLAVNVKADIELDEQTVATLKAHNLI